MTATVYQLKHPINYMVGEKTETLTHLEMRRPTGKDLLLIDSFQTQPMRLVLEMIAALSGQFMTIVERLDAEDLGPLGDLAFANVEGGPKTGAIT